MNGVLNELNENGVDIKSVIERFAGNEIEKDMQKIEDEYDRIVNIIKKYK